MAKTDTYEHWQSTLEQSIGVLGHRNWIVVTDSAYPEQVAPGVVTIATGEEFSTVLQAVQEIVNEAAHVRSIAYLDTELNHLDAALAPGIDAFRAELSRALEGQETLTLPHEDIIEKLDAAGARFRVLILKTNLTLPYTSVFFQLECGYWNEVAEAELRKTMDRAR